MFRRLGSRHQPDTDTELERLRAHDGNEEARILAPQEIPRISLSEVSITDSRQSHDLGWPVSSTHSTATLGQHSVANSTEYSSSYGVHTTRKRTISQSDSQKRGLSWASLSPQRKNFWTPWSLRTYTICVFGLIFVAILISIEVMYQVSQSHRGLSSPDPHEHYGWTYGPVAVFTAIAAIWGQLEYRVKQLTPWKELYRRPMPAGKNILLDYIGPWNVIAFFKSIKGRHFPVTLAIGGNLLLKLLIIISTGFLMLEQQTIVKNNAPVQIIDKFDPKVYNSSFQDTYPALSVNGVKRFGLSMLPGVISDDVKSYAVQSFSAVGSNADVAISIGATVDSFSADLECEEAKINSTGSCPTRCTAVTYDVTAVSPTCELASDLQIQFFPTQPYVNYAAHHEVSCKQTNGTDDGYRWLLLIVQHRGSGVGAKIPMGETVAMICKPTYQFQQSYTVLDSDGSVNLANSKLQTSSSPAATTFNSTDIARGVDVSITASYKAIDSYTGSSSTDSGGSSSSSRSRRDSLTTRRELLPRDSPFSGWNWSNTLISSSKDNAKLDFGSFFYLMNATLPQSDPASFGDTDVLKSAARQTYSLMAAQMAKRRMMSLADDSLTGSVTISEQRLMVRELSLRVMQTILVLLIIITISLWFLAPRAVTPNDTSTLGGLATVLAPSTAFVTAIRGLGHQGISQLATQLSSRSYQTLSGGENQQRTFMIGSTTLTSESGPTSMNTILAGRIHRWEPMSLTIVARTIIVIITVALLAILEIVFQISEKHNGLSTIVSNGIVRYSWLYLPAFIMLLIRSLFDLVDVETRIITPYHQMKKKPTPARRSILVNYLSKITPLALLESIRNRHFAVTATAASMFLSPFLTIVVSGLYTTEPTRYEHPITIRLASSFNTTPEFQTVVDATGTQTSLLSSLILNSNLSYPAWTYGELALPELDTASLSGLDNMSLPIGDNTTSLVIRAPALRGSMNCTYTPTVYAQYSEFSDHEVNHVLIPIPVDGCETDTTRNASSYLTVEGSSWYGKTDTATTLYGNDMSDICPQLNVLWGFISPSELTPAQDPGENEESTGNIPSMQGAYCYPTISTVETDITFALPNFTITSAVPDESTVKVVVSRVNATISLFDILSEDVGDKNSHFLGGFSTLLKNKVNEEYLAKANSQQVMDDIEHLYRVVMAQYLNIGARAAAPENQTLIAATFVESRRMRLKQSLSCTRILEAILAAMTLCAAAAFLLTDSRYLLPAEPCSIATMAALLADSELVNDDKIIPHGSEWCDYKEMQRRGLFEGYMFSLGWWGKRGGGLRYFGVDIGKADPSA